MNFALEYSERADALIMVGSGPGGFSYDDWTPSALDEEMEAAYEAGDLERICEVGMKIFVDGTGRSADEVDAVLRQKVYDMNMIALNNEKLRGKDIPLAIAAAERLAELQMPVLIVYGDLDEDYIARAAQFMEDNISSAQRVLMPGTAHLPNMEFPQEFNAHVQEFLDTL